MAPPPVVSTRAVLLHTGLLLGAACSGVALAAASLAVHFLVLNGRFESGGELTFFFWIPAALVCGVSGFIGFYGLAVLFRRAWLGAPLLAVALAALGPALYVFAWLDGDCYPAWSSEAEQERWWQRREPTVDDAARRAAAANPLLRRDVGRVLHVTPGPRRGQTIAVGMNDVYMDVDLVIRGDRGTGTLVLHGRWPDKDDPLPAVEWQSAGKTTAL